MLRNQGSAQDAEVVLFTDGACSGNPGPGGWAFLMRHNPTGKELEDHGAEASTTNNQMELRAVIEGLKRLKRRTKVHVVSDSSYVLQGITQWIHNWKRNGWRRKTSSGYKPVKNADYWKRLDQAVSRHDVSFEHVRGHSGHPENERCDELAVAAYKELME
ncbi:MAG TPA: ribonuclease HI [Acidobacteriota bacterium]|nr:ribonuclease HI [Acidobacteriota bacterium]